MDRLRFIHQYLRNLNIFNTDKDDQHLRRNEVISTRIYLILLIIILSSFTMYMSLLNQTMIITIPTPSQSQYEQLELQFSDQLQCPCVHIAISYEDFITINPSYHEVCTSDFISQRWIDYLFYENASYYYQLDFRRSASYHFQILRTLCGQAQQTVEDNLAQFDSQQFITNQVILPKIFDIQINSSIKLFQITTQAGFQNMLKLIRETLINNELFSAIDVRYNLQYEGLSFPYVSMYEILYFETQFKGKSFGCYCGNNMECKLPKGIYANINQYIYAGSNWIGIVNATTSAINATILIPGMYAGCSSIESLMESTNECLFNKSCLNTILSYLYYETTPINLTTSLNISRFAPQTPLETIANELFLEDWNINKSYEKYFNQCQPLFCQYTKQQKYDIVHIFTATVSLYGGLRLFLSFLIPIIVKFIRKKESDENETENITSLSGKFYRI